MNVQKERKEERYYLKVKSDRRDTKEGRSV